MNKLDLTKLNIDEVLKKIPIIKNENEKSLSSAILTDWFYPITFSTIVSVILEKQFNYSIPEKNAIIMIGTIIVISIIIMFINFYFKYKASIFYIKVFENIRNNDSDFIVSLQNEFSNINWKNVEIIKINKCFETFSKHLLNEINYINSNYKNHMIFYIIALPLPLFFFHPVSQIFTIYVFIILSKNIIELLKYSFKYFYLINLIIPYFYCLISVSGNKNTDNVEKIISKINENNEKLEKIWKKSL